MKKMRIKVGDAHIMKEYEEIPDEVPEVEVYDSSGQRIIEIECMGYMFGIRECDQCPLMLKDECSLSDGGEENEV